ncbi:hypothetical protein ZWY2020_047369 [Hordeum vulgare]|nr:hypothetical protein ZWY2020_047369 [Hordeum vulgare]
MAKLLLSSSPPSWRSVPRRRRSPATGMLQDLCVADYNSLEGRALRVNGYPCKQAENVTADDFFYAGLASAADVYGGGNPMGSVVTAADAERLPGLNTLGVSMSRVDSAPWGGTNPPHAHPRATEILFVAEGTLEVGFVTTAGRHITRAVPKGGVFVFPRGMMHYERSVGEAPAVAISAFDSQLPGTQRLGEAMFRRQRRQCRPTCWPGRCGSTAAWWRASGPSSSQIK